MIMPSRDALWTVWNDATDERLAKGAPSYETDAVMAVVMAWHGALIAEVVAAHEGMMGPWPEGMGTLVADWLRENRPEGGEG